MRISRQFAHRHAAGWRAALALVLATILTMPSIAAAQSANISSNPIAGDRADLAAWKAQDFLTDTPDRTVLVLASMMTSADPFLRDEIGFTGLSAILRRGDVSEPVLLELIDLFTDRLSAPDPDGVVRPFAVLGLSEVARVDRVTPFLDDAKFDSLATTGTTFLAGVEDYRGYDPAVGWRHNVPHAADLMLQLALNPRTSTAQLDRMASVLTTQVAPAEPYIHGEPQRLARALLFIARHENGASIDWSALFTKMMADYTMRTGDGGPQGATMLERLALEHNLRVFLLEIYASAVSSKDDRLEPLGTAALEQLAKF